MSLVPPSGSSASAQPHQSLVLQIAAVAEQCDAQRWCSTGVDIGMLIFVFLGLAIVCDDYLCPAIDILCARLRIPDEAAGASFLAFGSAAPEIMINFDYKIPSKLY